MGDDFTHADAVKEITFLWNEWADSAENVLRAMIDQMEDRAVSHDDSRTLAARLSAYPARPALPAVGSHDVSGGRLNGVWNAWADAVEMIGGDMKRVIDRSVPLPREEQMFRAGGGPVGFGLGLANRHPPPVHVAAHLRTALRDRTVACDGLADFMEFLNIG